MKKTTALLDHTTPPIWLFQSEETPTSQFITPLSHSICIIQSVAFFWPGIACVLMVLRWLRQDNEYPLDSTLLEEEREQRKILLENIHSESIWTADLVLQIHKLFQNEEACSYRYLFSSKVTEEVDSDYKDVGYYSAAFGSDQIRVNNIFHELKRLEASTLCTPRLPLRCVINAVGLNNCVAIVLIDNTVLKSREIINDGVDRYTGHYVILCGTSKEKEHLRAAHEFEGAPGRGEDYCLVLCDPGQNSTPLLFVTAERFERSWLSKGTDEDIIFIAQHLI